MTAKIKSAIIQDHTKQRQYYIHTKRDSVMFIKAHITARYCNACCIIVLLSIIALQ